MTAGALTVGTTPVPVPVAAGLVTRDGMRLLARAANSGSVYVSHEPAVTTATGNLLPKGDPGTVSPYTVPAEHFRSGAVYLVASAAGQVVDWSAS